MDHWPQYESHKVVRAAKIIRIVKNDAGRVVDLIVKPTADGELESFMPTQAGMEDRIVEGDYAMLYPDGFRSVQPAKAFESGYTAVSP